MPGSRLITQYVFLHQLYTKSHTCILYLFEDFEHLLGVLIGTTEFARVILGGVTTAQGRLVRCGVP